MRAVLDACVLYPPILRELLLGCAERGLYEPLVSDRILREWTLATVKLGPVMHAQAETEARLFRASFPRAVVPEASHIEASLLLPDPDDVHVLASAIAGHGDAIITFNAKDFPGHVLAAEGITRRDPDGFLWEMWSHHPMAVGEVIAAVHVKACTIAGDHVPLKSMLKRSKLGRLARAVQSET